MDANEQTSNVHNQTNPNSTGNAGPTTEQVDLPTNSSDHSEDHSTKEPEEIKRMPNGEEEHCCLANLFFCFMFQYLCMCHPITDRDMWRVHSFDAARPATERLMPKYRQGFREYDQKKKDFERRREEDNGIKEKPPKFPNLLSMLFTSQSSYTIPVGVGLLLVSTALSVMQPFMSKRLLAAIVAKALHSSTGGSEGSNKFPYLDAIWLLLSPAVTALLDSNGFRLIFHFAARIRSAMVGVIYDKVFRIKNLSSAGSADTGRILSLVSTDSRIVAEQIQMFIMLFTLPANFIVPLVFIVIDFKWVVVIPLAVSLLMLIPSTMLISKMMTYVKLYMAFNDSRNRITNETLQGIRVVKYTGLEEVFKATINQSRKGQIKAVQHQQFLMQTGSAIMRITPNIVQLSTFSVYCAVFSSDATNFATVVMPMLSYITMMTAPTTQLPMFIEAANNVRINTQRISQFLWLPELEVTDAAQGGKTMDEKNALEIVGGEFQWGAAPPVPLTGAEVTRAKKEAERRKKENKKMAAMDSQSNPDPEKERTTNLVQVESAQTLKSPNTSPAEYQKEQKSEVFQDAPAQKDTNDSNNQEVPSSPTINPAVTPSYSPSPSRPSSSLSSRSRSNGPTLLDINLTIPKGSLTMIVGEVGSGKSSIGSAIVGDIERTAGSVRMDGSCTYCPQVPWIINDTVRGNITFGAPFDKDRYDETVRVCALQADFQQFSAGDQTAIGEKGVNMSGGQKARIQLARAVYSNKDIVILDDPLSAVDAHVGRVLMDECICGVLKGKTVILMTNQLQFLERADNVVVIDNGRITAQGTYEDIREQGIDFDEFFIKTSKPLNKAEKNGEKKGKADEKDGAKKSDGNGMKILTEEEQETGSVKLSSYAKYIATLLPAPLAILFLVIIILAEAAIPVSTWWLGIIGSTTAFPSLTFWWKVGIFGFITIGIFAILFVRTFFACAGAGRAARINHDRLLDSVMKCPVSFFDTTPMGRILNRFTGDIPLVDQFLVARVFQVLALWINLIGQIVIVAVNTVWFLAIGIPVLFLYYLVLVFYSRVSRNLMRLEAIARSPVLSIFAETVTGAGLTTIRSYGKEDEWKERFYKANDELSVPFILFRVSMKSATMYSSFISSLLTTGVVLIGWFFMDASKLSVAIMSSMTFANMAITLIQQNVDLESKMTGFERVNHYSSNLPQEAQGHELEVPESWPERGDVTFDQVRFKYRPGLPFVLKGVNFEINGGEKIGVCGRTGAGKSSLLFALFRLVELEPKHAPKIIDPETGFLVDPDLTKEPNSGRILIDGVDISKLDIHRVRKSVAIIPQDPTLFTGTIRYNLDIEGKASDDRIWEVLEMIEMRDAIAELPLGLDSQVAEGGSNFSAGQRQLLCFGRAMLNNCRVVVMDEATANVDAETDAKIQTTIREQFNGITVIVIAHRLNTILDSDRILVMDQGEISEYDTPQNLKANPNSAFNSLLESLNQ